MTEPRWNAKQLERLSDLPDSTTPRLRNLQQSEWYARLNQNFREDAIDRLDRKPSRLTAHNDFMQSLSYPFVRVVIPDLVLALAIQQPHRRNAHACERAA